MFQQVWSITRKVNGIHNLQGAFSTSQRHGLADKWYHEHKQE